MSNQPFQRFFELNSNNKPLKRLNLFLKLFSHNLKKEATVANAAVAIIACYLTNQRRKKCYDIFVIINVELMI